MYSEKLKKENDFQWYIDPVGEMNVRVVIYADKQLLKEMDEKVYEQAANVSKLPGIVKASYAMPDAHWGYGFPIGGVAAFDAEKGGVISAGGVGFDIACGVRSLVTGLSTEDIEGVKKQLADKLAEHIPAGLGSTGKLHLSRNEIEKMLQGGSRWAVEKGYGTKEDLLHTEEGGQMSGAKPGYVSEKAKNRQQDQVGTLGSGNHYLEVQKVTDIYNKEIAAAFGLEVNDIVVSIHCGSRGLGHQIGTDYLPQMARGAGVSGIRLPEKELACAPITSELGKRYFGAMNCGVNCAVANRQVLTSLTRDVFGKLLPKAELKLLYDVSHNTCKVEEHPVGGRNRKLYVHRKGATRAFAPGDASLPEDLKPVGQPVLIGGTMGTASYILAGTKEGMELAFGSCCHGAGRAMSRTKAKKKWYGENIVKELAERDILIRGVSMRGVAEEAPGAYKDVTAVVNVTHKARLANKVARLEPMICVKG